MLKDRRLNSAGIFFWKKAILGKIRSTRQEFRFKEIEKGLAPNLLGFDGKYEPPKVKIDRMLIRGQKCIIWEYFF